MDLPPQPPPDAPAPPPGPEAIRSRRIMRGILSLGVISAVVFFGFLFLPTFVKVTPSPAPRTIALGNIRQIGLYLFQFEHAYGSFPDATTVTKIKPILGSGVPLGNSSSNALLRQLLVLCSGEKIFWAKTTTTPRIPNGIEGVDALAPGECAFTYIAGLTSTSHPDAPILMTPVIPGTWKFDPKPFDGKAVVLFLDASATALPIDKNGDVILNGMNLFDPRQPYWHGKAPDIKYPE